MIKTNISYNFLNSLYNSTDHPISFAPLHYGTFISKIRSNTLGVSIGAEYFVLKDFSINSFLTYNKNIKRKTDVDINMTLGKDLYYKNTSEIIEDTKSEKSISLELAYYFRKFSINPGFEYTFTEQPFYLTENTGYRYKFYTLFIYRI